MPSPYTAEEEELSLEVRPGDTQWDTLYAAWVREGSPPRFERWGVFGGRRYQVLEYDTDTPTFLVHVADGPTELDLSDPDDDGGIKKQGYVCTVIGKEGQTLRADVQGKVTIKRGTTPLEKD